MLKIKKSIFIIVSFLAFTSLYAEKYQIKSIEYSTEGAFGFGKTNPYALNRTVEVDKKRIFEDY